MYKSISFVSNKSALDSPKIVDDRFNSFFKDRDVKIINVTTHAFNSNFVMNVIYEEYDMIDTLAEEIIESMKDCNESITPERLEDIFNDVLNKNRIKHKLKND